MLDEIKSNWNEIIEYLRNTYNINDVLFRTWVLPLEPFHYDEKNNLLTVIVDDSVSGDIIELLIDKKYNMYLQLCIETIINKRLEIEFKYKSECEEKGVSTYYNISKEKELIEKYPFLNNDHSFDTFVSSVSNNLAYATSLAVAENPSGKMYNPLFLYSSPGLGKTHLLHSIARYILENHPEYNVYFTTSEDFTNDVVNAIRMNKSQDTNAATIQLREKYRSVDVLLIDDIQFIIGRDSTQLEFFNTFESLYQSGKRIIISSDRPPSQMEQLHERYRTRFQSGSIIDIQQPDYETCKAILLNKQTESDININEDIIEYIITNVNSNIRELEGAYQTIIMYTRFNLNGDGSKMDIEHARNALKNYITPDKKNITAEYIIGIVADHFSIDKEMLLSTRKNKEFSIPRQIIMYFCNEYTNLTQKKIAEKLKRKNHTTVIHGIDNIVEKIKVDNDLAETIEIIRKKINP